MLFSQYFLAKFFEGHVFGIRERWRHFALVGICNKQHPTQCAFVSHTYIVISFCSKKKNYCTIVIYLLSNQFHEQNNCKPLTIG